MKLLDSITVHHQGMDRMVMLFVGDLASLPEQEAVDALVVSAFPRDYTPTPTSLIGALHRKKVSVAALAADKAVDLRDFSSCWLSQKLNQSNVHFRRVLCFEPAVKGRAPQVVGDIFRSLVPFAAGSEGISTVALPLVASGDQGEPPGLMLEKLVETAVHWLSIGLPLDRIKIVLSDSAPVLDLTKAFAETKQRLAPAASSTDGNFRFDFFISYSHADSKEADKLVESLRSARPSLRVFLDRLELQPGHSWQQHIFDAIDESRRVVCLMTPAYLESKICKEEYNIALLRNRESKTTVLLPVYAKTAKLPSYMKLVQYEDAREADNDKILQVATKLAAQSD